MRILVADDAPDIRRLLGLLLRMEGHDVDEAEDGQEALDKLETARYDALVSDHRMPRVEGLELLARAHRQWPDMRLVLVTAYPSGALKGEVEAMGGTFVTKPFEPAEMVAAVTGTPRRPLPERTR